MTEQLAIAMAAGYTEGVSYAKREIRVLEQELDFAHYKVWGVS